MKIELTVEYLDGTKQDVDAVFADFVGFERTWQRSVAKFEQDMRLTDLAWLAWSACKHRKLTALAFDPDWIGTVAMVTPREAANDPKDENTETTQPIG